MFGKLNISYSFAKLNKKNGPSVETAALNDCLPYENS